VGRAAAVLSAPRVRAAAAVLAALVAYYLVRESLPNVSNNWDVALIAGVLMPAVFSLVYLALPLRRARGLLLVGLAVIAVALVFDRAGLDVAANFGKLAGMTLLAFAFLEVFETVLWVVLVASLIPWVDAFSVWRGPTEHIVKEQPDVFRLLSFSFPVPGEGGAANLGLPDILFFALFLGAAARFGLRTGWTWVAMTLSLALTMTLAVAFDVAGLPALPLLSLGFLVPNADLLWRAFRSRGDGAVRGDPTESPPEPEPARAD
jgi:hypothetical protein